MSIVMFSIENYKKMTVLIFLYLHGFIYSQIQKKLDNGLDVFITENNTDKQETLFYLFLKVGSINENSNQLGYAHFLEHLAFKGGRRFQKNMEGNLFNEHSLQVGEDYNAVTNYDYTIYKIKISKKPTKQIQNQIFNFYSDIIDELNFTNKDVQSEKKIILAEKKLRGKPTLDFTYKIANTTYEKRLPIGTEISIKKANEKQLKKFYNKYYTPKNSAIFVIGSIDSTECFQLISTTLGNVNKPKSKKIKKNSIYTELSNDIRIIENVKLPKTKIQILKLQKVTECNNEISLIYNTALKNRLKKVLMNLTSNLTITQNYFLSDVNCLSILANTKKPIEVSKNILLAFKQLNKGISQEELDFTKDLILNIKKPTTYTNQFLIDKQIECYLGKGLVNKMGINTDLLRSISVSDIKEYCNKFYKNSINKILIEEPKLVTKKENIDKVLNSVTKEQTVPYTFTKPLKDDVVKKTNKKTLQIPIILTSQIPQKITEYKNLGIKRLYYKNGISVILKPIKNGSKEFSITASSLGGYSSIAPEKYYLYESSESYIDLGGIANLTHQELEELMTTNPLSISFTISDFNRSINGFTTQKNSEFFFKFLHAKLNYSKPNKKEFDLVISEEIESLKSYKLPNKFKTSKKIILAQLLGSYFPERRTSKSKKDYKSIDVYRMSDFFNHSFKFSNGWNYIVIGDFDEKKIIPIINKYLGNLKRTNSPISNKIFNYSKLNEFHLLHSIDSFNSQKNHIEISYHPYQIQSLKEEIMLLMYESYIQKHLTYLLRVKNGIVYNVDVQLSKLNDLNTINIIKIDYSCEDSLYLKSLDILNNFKKELNNLKLNNFEFNQIKKRIHMLFEQKLNNSESHSWDNLLKSYMNNLKELNDVENIFKTITKKDFCEFVNKFQEEKTEKKVIVE